MIQTLDFRAANVRPYNCLVVINESKCCTYLYECIYFLLSVSIWKASSLWRKSRLSFWQDFFLMGLIITAIITIITFVCFRFLSFICLQLCVILLWFRGFRGAALHGYGWVIYNLVDYQSAIEYISTGNKLHTARSISHVSYSNRRMLLFANISRTGKCFTCSRRHAPASVSCLR